MPSASSSRRDHERRADHDDVPVRHEVEAALERRLREPRDRRGGIAGGVERDERLARLAVPDELEPPEAAEAAHLADRRVLLLELRAAPPRRAAHLGGVLDDALLAERLDRRDADRARERMAAVRQAAGEVLVRSHAAIGSRTDIAPSGT